MKSTLTVLKKCHKKKTNLISRELLAEIRYAISMFKTTIDLNKSYIVNTIWICLRSGIWDQIHLKSNIGRSIDINIERIDK